MRYALPLLLLLPATAVADDAARLSARIDELVAAGWQGKAEPAPLADDAEFFRRLCLDLTGRIPSLALVRDFLEDDRPDKRRQWADELLDHPDFADRTAARFAAHWRAVLFAQSNLPGTAPPVEDWLRRQFRANAPYDKLVRGLLTSPETTAFFTAYENKPEHVAGATARVFLGLRLECAQCHADRSGGSWTQEQFWQFAAFFARLPGPRLEGNRAVMTTDAGTGPPRIKVADTERYVSARYLDAVTPDWTAGADPRAVLAAWITRPDNRWFARAAANRVWHFLLGTGLVDPVDGLGADDNPPSHPELLDELARELVAHDFDLKFLVRAVVGSKTYQRTSRQTHPGQADPRRFARMPVRGLSAEQLFDSVVEATGYVPETQYADDYKLGAGPSPRARFLAKFPTQPDQPVDAQTSIQQALYLMNGQLSAAAVSVGSSKTLATVAAASASPADQVEQLFLLTLSRKPTAAEAARLVKHVASGKDRNAALADVFWVLLNSTEFALNH